MLHDFTSALTVREITIINAKKVKTDQIKYTALTITEVIYATAYSQFDCMNLWLIIAR